MFFGTCICSVDVVWLFILALMLSCVVFFRFSFSCFFLFLFFFVFLVAEYRSFALVEFFVLFIYHDDQVFVKRRLGFTLAILYCTDNTSNVVSLTDEDGHSHWWQPVFHSAFRPATTFRVHFIDLGHYLLGWDMNCSCMFHSCWSFP